MYAASADTGIQALVEKAHDQIKIQGELSEMVRNN